MDQLNRAIIMSCLFTTALVQSGCAILIGNVDPVAHRSGDYDVLMLSDKESNWNKLDPRQTLSPDESGLSEDEAKTRTSDLTFQSRKTASIISLNSSCRDRVEGQKRSLREYTNLLLLECPRSVSGTRRPLGPARSLP